MPLNIIEPMPDYPTLPEVLQRVAKEPSAEKALDDVLRAAAAMTRSRNAILAVLNEEQGCLEVRHVTGHDLTGKEQEEQVLVQVEGREGIMAYVAATGESVLTGDVDTDPHYRRLFATTRSEIAVPVRDVNGRMRAVFNLESDRLNAYGDREKELSDGIAGIFSLLLMRIEGEAREEALIQVGMALDNSLTEEALVEEVIHVASDVLRFQAASLFLHDPATDTFILRGSVGVLKNQIGQIGYKRGEGCTGWVCDRGEPVLLNNPQADDRWLARHVEFPSGEIAAFLCVPILSRKKSIGAIRVVRRVSENPYLDNGFTQDDLRLLTAIAEQVASGLENVRNMEKIIRSERMIAWGELSAKSSHMIGNRVFALKGDVNELAHILSSEKVDVGEVKELQRSLEINLNRVEEILQDFRDFVSATQLHREPANLNAMVLETVDEVFPKRSPIHLDMKLDEDLPLIEIDAKKLRRAVSELIENSISWMEEGRLRVETSLVPRGEYPQTRSSKTKLFARIEIEDTGPGVKEEQKNTIFQPFYTGRVKGMGLGLSIVKGIVDAHGGEVFEAGEVGRGANFVILLPAPDRP